MHSIVTSSPAVDPITSKPMPHDPRAAQILARTLYKDMLGHGLDPQQILGVASELIGLLTEDLRDQRASSGRGQA